MPTKIRDCCMYARTPYCVVSTAFKPFILPQTYRVSNNSDSVSSCQTRQADTETAREVHESVEQAVVLLRWRLHVAGNQDRNHQGIHGNNTRHDDRDEGLRVESAVVHSTILSLSCHGNSSMRTFMIRSDLKVPTPAIPIPDFAVPYAAPMPVPCLATMYSHISSS